VWFTGKNGIMPSDVQVTSYTFSLEHETAQKSGCKSFVSRASILLSAGHRLRKDVSLRALSSTTAHSSPPASVMQGDTYEEVEMALICCMRKTPTFL
jgi:hypothetical protein